MSGNKAGAEFFLGCFLSDCGALEFSPSGYFSKLIAPAPLHKSSIGENLRKQSGIRILSSKISLT